jgi:flavin-dependent dehydrogenase
VTVERYDAVVVGGGPAGSSCAAELVRGGAKVLVLDRAAFPRLKLCAGWITPQVVADLDLDIEAYPHRFNTFERIVAHAWGVTVRMPGPQHSIRRTEFDRYLLERSGAPVRQHNVRSIEHRDGRYVLDGEIECEHLVGAGGTRCPVYRELFREANPRARTLQAATWEHELPCRWEDPRCHLWFFDRGLPGYAWYVPKAGGYLNLGIGAMAERLKARGEDIRSHWRHFIGVLKDKGFIPRDLALDPTGYSYYVRREGVEVARLDNTYITGDSAGLATRDLCEGIGPAVKSGQLAARAIVEGTEYSLEGISAYSGKRGLARSLLEYMLVRRKITPAVGTGGSSPKKAT